MTSTPKIFAPWHVVLLGAFLAAPGCKKPLPDENVSPFSAALGGSPGVPWGSGGRSAGGAGGAAPGAGGAGAGGGGSSPGAGGNPGAAGSVVSAGGAGPDAGPTPFTKALLLDALAGCAMGHYRELEGFARTLMDATGAMVANPDDVTRSAAATAFRDAMASWQRAELFSFGPAARAMEPGGADLRDNIYFFPLANLCKVDQQIVDQSYADPARFLLPAGASARGLSASEYLLFHAGPENSCSPFLSINTRGTWQAIAPQDLATRRAAYAHQVSVDVHARAAALVRVWEPSGGNFTGTFVGATSGNAVFATDSAALNAASNALFYVDKELKDSKLAIPLGLMPECLSSPSPCPEAFESRFALTSTDNIRQNLVGFRRAFEGCGPDHAGVGFDDWLVARRRPDLATEMLDALRSAQGAVDALDMPIEQLATEDLPRARSVHTAVKRLTDLLKTDFVTVLDLELPMSAEGDND